MGAAPSFVMDKTRRKRLMFLNMNLGKAGRIRG
jgi:hypothetical protein